MNRLTYFHQDKVTRGGDTAFRRVASNRFKGWGGVFCIPFASEPLAKTPLVGNISAPIANAWAACSTAYGEPVNLENPPT